MYIKKDNVIIDSETKNEFKVDDLIADSILILNTKGYKTTSCCSAHYIEDTSIKVSIPKSVTTREILNNWLYNNHLEYLGEDMNYFYYNGKILAGTCYVTFEEGIELPMLPSLFKYDKQNNSVYCDILYYDNLSYKTKREKEDVEEEIATVNSSLNKWVITLPEYSKEFDESKMKEFNI